MREDENIENNIFSKKKERQVFMSFYTSQTEFIEKISNLFYKVFLFKYLITLEEKIFLSYTFKKQKL